MEVRATGGGAFAHPVGRWSEASSSGDVTGMPSVLAAGRLISETIAAMGVCVYTVVDGEERTEAASSWQYELLHARPNEWMTPFQVMAHKVWSLLFSGEAFELKSKAGGEVVELFPLDPTSVKVHWTAAGPMYDVQTANGVVRLTRADVLHTVGMTTGDARHGRSVIDLAGASLRKALHAETYQRRFWENDATPGGLLSTPERLTKQQRDELKGAWQDRHGGPGNAGKLAVLDANASYQAIGVSPRDAQFVESAKFSVQEVARIFRVPSGLLGDTEAQMAASLEDENRRFYNMTLKPWIARIEEALKLDTDLFPMGVALEPEFDTDNLLLADMKTRYESALIGRQAGWLSVNDVRAMEDLPPIPGGDVYQQTPVGGAPNLQPQGDGNAAA